MFMCILLILWINIRDFEIIWFFHVIEAWGVKTLFVFDSNFSLPVYILCLAKITFRILTHWANDQLKGFLAFLYFPCTHYAPIRVAKIPLFILPLAKRKAEGRKICLPLAFPIFEKKTIPLPLFLPRFLKFVIPLPLSLPRFLKFVVPLPLFLPRFFKIIVPLPLSLSRERKRGMPRKDDYFDLFCLQRWAKSALAVLTVLVVLAFWAVQPIVIMAVLAA